MQKGTKYYGASLTFFEKYTKSLTEAQKELLELSTFADEALGLGKNTNESDKLIEDNV